MKLTLYFRTFVLVYITITATNTKAQDFLINFNSSIQVFTLDSVIVENITQGTLVKMKGTDTLHLVGIFSGIDRIKDIETSKIRFYPNPMKDYTKMQFFLAKSGEAMISLYDVSGRIILQTRDFLSTGWHTYVIQGVKEGIYFVRINSDRHSLNGRIISSGSNSRNARILRESTEDEENVLIAEKVQTDMPKGLKTETVLQYNRGDRLKYTGIPVATAQL